jgi:hypothetical protein
MKGLPMRPWMIVLSSAIGAIVLAVALAVPEILNAPPAEIGPIVLPHLPALAVASLAVFALCVMLLTTATSIAGILRVRYHFAGTAPERLLLQREWVTGLGATGFRQLATKLALVPAPSAGADGRVVLQTRFSPNEARREIARHYYISLARSHYFSALILLAGVIGLGLAQDYGSVPFLDDVIPTTAAVLVLIGLILLTVLGRIAIDVTAEPLLETISQLPAEHVEVGLLRRAVELLEFGRTATTADDDRSPAAAPQLPDQLMAIIEQGQHAQLEAIGRLTSSTQALGAAVRSSVETLETTIRATTVQQPSVADDKLADVDTISQLQAAIVELTAVLQRLSALPEDSQEAPLPADSVARPRTPPPHLTRELQQLLEEIEAAR